jgi:hypothetical protein
MQHEACDLGTVKSMLMQSVSCVVEYSCCGNVSFVLCFLLLLATKNCDLIFVHLPPLPDCFHCLVIEMFCTLVKLQVNLYFYVF